MPDEYTPNSVSNSYQTMSSRWDTVTTVLKGTEAMRHAGTTYLPAHVAESERRYQDRLRAAVLRNITEDTLDTLSGKPFSEPIKRNEDIPSNIEEYFDDIDSLGNNLDSFAKEWFRSAISKAFCHVLVEFPRIEPKEDGTERTLADDRNQGLRPYLVRVEPENLIFLRTERVNGQEITSHARIRRTVTIPVDRWGDREIIEIMVLEPNSVELYRLEDPDDPESKWMLYDGWPTGLNFVPLVTFYTNYESTALGKPPLLDLAYVNIAHWQSSSDQRVILSTARLPILAASGITDEEAEKIEIGPFKFIHTSGENSKFYYVEHQGKAIEAGAKDLASLEDWMASYGAEFLKQKPGAETATARALDSAEAMSKLQAWVIDFEDRISVALGFMQAWVTNGKDFEGGTVELVSDYGFGELEGPALDALIKVREGKDISRIAMINELKRRDILDETYDAEADQELIDEETANLLALGGSLTNLEEDPEDDEEGEDDELDDDDKPKKKKKDPKDDK